MCESESVCVCVGGSCVHGSVYVWANLFISVYMKVRVLSCVNLDK